MLDYQKYYQRFKAIAKARQWEPLHSPRNLAQAVMVESAELLAEFQWLSDEDCQQLNQQQRIRIGAEVADVMLYAIALAEAMNLDVAEIVETKMADNEQRFLNI